MSIIDSIQLSGSSYDVRDKSATTVVSLTQQEYDALPSSAKTANILYNITDATAGDLTQYWTSAQTQSAITEAVSGKQDVLVSGTNIKTINNESILGSGNITIQGGGTDTGTVQTMIDQSISGKADSSTVTAVQDSLSGYVYTADNGKQDIFGTKAFIGSKKITFTQAESSDKLGFTLYDVRDGQGNAKEFAAFELNPSGITENSVTHPLLTLNHYRKNSGRDVQTYIGYRQYDQPNSAAYHLLAPLPENAKHPFYLTTTFQNYYFPLGFKNGSTMIKADNTGVVNLSSEFGGKVDTSAITTSVTSSSTDAQVPSAKAVYDAIQEGGGSSYTAGDGIDITNDVISVTGKVDTSTYTAYTASTDAALATKQTTLTAGTGIVITDNVISATGGSSITVDSALDSGSTNPVENQALWDELRLGGAGLVETTIEWSSNYSTNYPSESTEIKLEFTSTGSTNIDFENETSGILGSVNITYYPQWGMVSVDNRFEGSTYEISGSTFTISYPSVTNVTKLHSGDIYNFATVTAIYNDPLIVLKDQVTANTAAIEAKVDTTTFNSYASSVDSALARKLNISDYVVDSALNVASTNPVQNQALYSELRIDNESGETETTLVFDGYRTTNYPQGCTKIKIEDITSNSSNNINFLADDGSVLGYITVSNWGSISVDVSNFQGASYEISGSSVIISYPTVTTVTKFDVPDSSKYTYKAITSSTTPLKDQVVANTTALGGLKLVKLTESAYQALSVKDPDTLYVVIPDPS